MKTIEDQGGNQINAIKDNKELDNTSQYFYEYKLLLSKERKVFKNYYRIIDKELITKGLINSYIVMIKLFQ